MRARKKQKTLRIITAETTEEYRHLGDWVAQIKGLPQARTYGKDEAEVVGRLILTFGKEHGIALLPAAELDLPRRKRL